LTKFKDLDTGKKLRPNLEVYSALPKELIDRLNVTIGDDEAFFQILREFNPETPEQEAAVERVRRDIDAWDSIKRACQVAKWGIAYPEDLENKGIEGMIIGTSKFIEDIANKSNIELDPVSL
jgi:hypothetical protein